MTFNPFSLKNSGLSMLSEHSDSISPESPAIRPSTGFVTSYPAPGNLRLHLQNCIEDGSLDGLFNATDSYCLYVPQEVRKGTHWGNVVFGRNQTSVVFEVCVDPTTTSRVDWFLHWSGAVIEDIGEGGSIPSGDQDAEELSTEAIFVRGFYIFKRCDETAQSKAALGELVHLSDTTEHNSQVSTGQALASQFKGKQTMYAWEYSSSEQHAMSAHDSYSPVSEIAEHIFSVRFPFFFWFIRRL
jgi:hypothetical protein